MNNKQSLLKIHRQILTFPSVNIRRFNYSDGCSKEELDRISEVVKMELPKELTDFYSELNEFSLVWTCENEGLNLYGSCDIVDIQTSIFGFNKQHDVIKDDRFEDVFWNDDFDEDMIQKLKSHYLLEVFEGSSEWTTFTLNQGKIKLYDIYIQDVNEYKISLQDYIKGIIMWGGLATVREEMLKTGVIPTKPFNEKSDLFFKLMNQNKSL